MHYRLQNLYDRVTHSSPPVQLAGAAVLLTPVNHWIGFLLAFTAAWCHLSSTPFNFKNHLWFFFALPYLAASVNVLATASRPPDDLLRHLSAWKVGFDYRAQYPWSVTPASDLWLGFDKALGWLQSCVGLSETTLVWLIPLFALWLSGVLLYQAFRRVASRADDELFLLFGALAILLCAPRMLLGRPEAFLSILAGAVWLCRTTRHAVVWSIGFVLLIPCYWLGWVYAPMALMLPLERRNRLWVTIGLVVVHLAFWQSYTKNYLALLIWLKGTLTVPAVENLELSFILPHLDGLLFSVLLAGCLALSLRKRQRLASSAPVLALVLWFAVPNQVRYETSLSLVALPWMLRHIAAISRLKLRNTGLKVPPLLVLSVLLLAGVAATPVRPPVPTFQLPATAKVLSEQPFATVFYGRPGIAVEPSYALGATKSEWKDILDTKASRLDCPRFKKAGFTYLVEHSLREMPSCANLDAIQGEWRLWKVKHD